jgi:hypothetical protein
MVDDRSFLNEFMEDLLFLDVQLCDVYKLVREKVENERPELANKLTNNLGLVFSFN